MTIDSRVVRAFEAALAPEDVISDPVRCRAYECDGLTGYRVAPELVLLPRDAEQVAAAVRVCHEHGVPFVARGAGTGLSGGAVPVADGVVFRALRPGARGVSLVLDGGRHVPLNDEGDGLFGGLLALEAIPEYRLHVVYPETEVETEGKVATIVLNLKGGIGEMTVRHAE